MADRPDEYDDDEDYDEDEGALDDCGMTPDGTCMLAGTEWCDWHCPLGAVFDLRQCKKPAAQRNIDAGRG